MTVVVFLGPTLELETARAHLPDAVYLPPAGQSDLLSAARRHNADVVALIDGYFRQQMAVWHKEILITMERGVHVYGASSMGALRAAELDDFGMVGVGQVYAWYESGLIDRDDEVAIIHGDAASGYRNLSTALVNIRATLAAAVAAGSIDDDESAQLLDVAASLHYTDRTYARVFEEGVDRGLSTELLERAAVALREHRCDVKRDDAILLLDRLRDLPDPLPPFEPPVEIERPHVAHAFLERDVQFERDGASVSHAEIAYHAALHEPNFTEFNFNALNRMLVNAMADMLELKVDDAMVEAEEERFRVRLGIVDDDEFAAWCLRNDVEADDFHELMTELARCRRMHRWILMRRNYRGTARAIVDGLRLVDRYEHVASEVALHKHLAGGEVFEPVVDTSDAQAMADAVLQHLRATDCRMDTHYRVWSHETGFPDLRSFAIELERSRRGRAGRDRMRVQLAEILGEAPDTNEP